MTRFLLVLLCSSVFAFSQAQITILSTDLPTAPDTLHNAVDTLPVGIAPGPKGANQTWNFSNVVQDIVETATHRIPAGTPYTADFPNATTAITLDGSNFGYFQLTTTAFKGLGLAGPLLGPGTTPVSVEFNPTFDLYRFPTQYNGNFTGTYGFQEETSGSSVGQPLVDRVRLTFTSTYFDTIDAWGTVVTPLGSYQALRQKRVERTYTKVEARPFFPPTWSTVDESRDTIITYTWLAKETKGPVVTITSNNAGTISRIAYSLTPPPTVANFSWTNPSGGLVQFTNLSSNATTYSWDFGDGSALSTNTNPNHIYVANGAYNVCLTATGTGGSDVECQTITVTNIGFGNSAPVAVNDSTTTPFETPVDINVLSNDIDPDGDDIAVTAAFGATDGTTTINSNGTITFTPNAGFSGWASFQYSICDDGVPSFCDTATVYVEVLGIPLEASFTSGFGTDSCLLVFVANTSTGYTGLVAWTFGDGSNGLGETITHTYAEPGTYLVCVTVSNGTVTDSACAPRTVDSCVIDGIGSINAVALQVYPNPATDQLTVVLPNGSQSGTLSIINNLGMLVKEITVTDARTTISISELAAGIYHLNYTNTHGTRGAGRFVKE